MYSLLSSPPSPPPARNFAMPPDSRGEALQEPGSSSHAGSSKAKQTLLELPQEIQKEIVKHVPRRHLKNVQLVSKHFHELASAELYNDLHFFLTHPDSPSYYNTPSFRPTFALHFFATSSHDYAQYVRTFGIFMSEQDPDEVQKRVASKYHIQEESSRLLNTALLLLVRKTHALERFTWHVPIDLDAEVYRTLSKIPSLQCLTVRHEITSIPRVSFTYHPQPPPLPSSVGIQPPIPAPGHSVFTSQNVPTSSNSPYVIKLQKHRLASLRTERQTLCHFKHLRELNVIGIDNMEIVDQAAICMQQCSFKLRSVALTLAPQFARKARAPAAGSSSHYAIADPMDDEDDDVTQPNTPSAPTSAATPAVNEADIRKERKAQETILARMFGFHAIDVDDKKVDKVLKAAAEEKISSVDPNEAFVQHLREMMAKMSKGRGGHLSSNPRRANFFDTLQKACETYLESQVKQKKRPGSKSTQPKAPSWASKAPKHKVSSPTPPIPPPAKWTDYPPFPSNSALKKKLKQKEQEAFHDLDFDAFAQEPLPPLPKSTQTPLFSPSWGGPSSSSGIFMPPNPGSSTSHQLPPPNPSSSSPFTYSHHPPPPNDGQMPLYYPSSSSHPHKPSSSSALSPSYWDYPPPVNTQPGSSSKSPLVPNVYSPPPPIDPPVQNGTAPAQESDSESSDSEDNDAPAGDGFKGGSYKTQSSVSDLGVDIDHPDVMDSGTDDETDPREDSSRSQSTGDASDDAASSHVPNGTTSQAAAPQADGTPASARTDQPQAMAPATKSPNVEAPPEIVLTPEEQMREYIRRKHGFSLECFHLYLVPLKASIIAKALDLSLLRCLTLLSVGPQGAFWSLMEKHHLEFKPLQLRSVHTDDVSLAFLSCLNKLSGITELYLVRRISKDLDCTTTKVPASRSDIRKLALRRHAGSLKRLSIMNNDDDSWDLDAKCFRLLAAKAKALEELAFSVEMSDFHTFIQCLPQFETLAAINIIALRSPDRMSSLSRECRKFLLDACNYHPELRLKYVATSGFVHEIGSVKRSARHQQQHNHHRSHHDNAAAALVVPPPSTTTPIPSSSAAPGAISPATAANGTLIAADKGKGKAKAVDPAPFDSVDVSGWAGSGLPPPPSANSDASDDSDDDSDEDHGLSDIEDALPEVVYVKHMKYCEVPDVEIFMRQVRLGRV